VCSSDLERRHVLWVRPLPWEFSLVFPKRTTPSPELYDQPKEEQSMVLFRRWALAAAALLLMGSTGARADFTIDNFQTGSSAVVFGTPAGPKHAGATANGAGIVGSFRDMYTARTSSNAGVVASDAGQSVPGQFELDTSASTGGYSNLVYDGSQSSSVPKGPVPLAGINYTGLGGVDLTESGSDIALTFKAASQAGATIDVVVYTDKNNFAQATINVPAGALSPLTQYNLLFASGFAITGGSFSFANVGAVTVTVTSNGNQVNTTLLGPIVTAGVVPEPGSFALMGMGLAGLAVYRRRKAGK